MSACALIQEVLYLGKLLQRLGYPRSASATTFKDHRTCIAWTEDLREHFVRDAVRDGILTLQTVSSAEKRFGPPDRAVARDCFSNSLEAPNGILSTKGSAILAGPWLPGLRVRAQDLRRCVEIET